MPSLHAVVHGDVQGVGFRDFVRRRAEEAGLAGWVRNLPGGGVELHAEGRREALDRLLAQVTRGPGLASVERVDAGWGEETGIRGFSIRY